MIHLRLLGSVDLRDELNGELRRVLTQPKRLAILAYLVLADGGHSRRDLLLAQFWPELDAARARAALRQALHHLRRELGEGVILTRTPEEVGVDPAEVQCDVTAFLAAIATGDDAAALSLYKGDLLAGVYFSDASPGWEAWLDAERAKLREMARGAARRRTAAAEAAGDREAAANCARRAFELAGEDETAFRELITTLDRAGDRLGIRRAYDAFERRLAREYDMRPSPETQSLVERLIADPHLERVLPASEAPAARPADVPATQRSPERTRQEIPRSTRAKRWIPAMAASAAIAIIAIGAALFVRRTTVRDVPVFAIGTFRDAAGDGEAADALSELLTTQLARSSSTQVVSSARLYELASQIDSTGRSPTRLSRAARAAGATEFIEGTIYRDSSGLRLELRRTELASGRALFAGAVVGSDVFTIAERAGARLSGSPEASPSPGTLRGVVSGSVVALRFYQEGIRARAQNDHVSAKRFFAAAVKEDSNFAMAVFRLGQETEEPGLYQRALRLAANTSDQERLIIRTALAHEQDDPARLQFADTLAVRYPYEPDGLLMRGRAQIAAAKFMDAVVTLRRVVDMDSLSLHSAGAECRACAAYSEMVTALNAADSLEWSERVAREFIRRAPHRVDAWGALAGVLQHAGRGDEGRAIVTKVEAMAPRPFGEVGGRSDYLQREGRYVEAEALIVRILNAAQGEDLIDALWSHIIVLRNQGRFKEALAQADRLRELDSRPPRQPAQFFWSAGMRALVLQDLGRYAEAAALRDSVTNNPFGVTRSRQGRSNAGEFTHEATARMLAGDTAGVRVLIDSVKLYGERTGYEQFRRLHHYVRGMYLRMTGHDEEAVRELRQGIYSPTIGYIRANYELGRALLATNRAAEAVRVMEAALRGSIGAGGLYATRTEMELLLAQAREAAGDTRGAAAAYARVAAAWERGDPIVQARRRLALEKSKQLAER